MFGKWLLALFLACFSLSAVDFEELINSERDLTFYHHVHVISGSFNLTLDEWQINGEVPITIRKTYNSQGALQRSKSDFDLKLKELRGGFLLQGGWDVFSYTNLLLYETPSGTLKAYVADPSGAMLVFDRNLDHNPPYTLLKTKPSIGFVSGSNSAMSFLENYSLYVDSQNGTAILILPNGGKRTYFRTIKRLQNDEIHQHNVFYRLVEEVLPSGHLIDYFYDEKKRLMKIETKSPDRTVVFCSLDFDVIQSKSPIAFKFYGSDGSKFSYKGIEFEGRDYLSNFSSPLYGQKQIEYEPGRKSIGAFLKSVSIDGKKTIKVDYYKPDTLEEEREWAKDDTKKRIEIDKVKKLYLPSCEDGSMQEFARFFYESDRTDVFDSKGKKTSYHHDGEKLNKIEYYDDLENIQSTVLLVWSERKLAAKLLLNEQGQALLSKTFTYDEAGNVIKEVLYGNLTGKKASCFDYLETGELIGSDSYQKEFSYSKIRNLLIEEKEEDGLHVMYEYLEGTNLLKAKFLIDDEKIIKREFFSYDQNNLLICQQVDDGKTDQIDDDEGVTFSTQVSYIRDRLNGKVIEKITYAKDLSSKALKQKEKITYTYCNYYKIKKEQKFDSFDQLQLSACYEYNFAGLVTEKKDNYGRVNRYTYDDKRRILTKKEYGSSLETYFYSSFGTVEEVEIEGSEFNLLYAYDRFGNPIFQQDDKGFKTLQYYDCFNRVKKIVLNELIDADGIKFQPFIEYFYDSQGNIFKQIDHLNQTVEIAYNAYRKPISTVQKDGSITLNNYKKNGLLSKTVFSDGSYIEYDYDLMGRVVCRRNFDSTNLLLWEERFEYDAFFLQSKIDKAGRKTRYTYNSFWQLIEEDNEGVKKRYQYDSLGRLAVESNATFSHYTEFNGIDQKIKSYSLNESGEIYLDTTYFYDQEGRLETVKKMTSSGIAIDQFTYDSKNRLIRHVDPLKNATNFEYAVFFKEGLPLLRKIITDAKNRKTIETYDPAGKVINRNQLGLDGQSLVSTAFFYDQAGNQVRVENESVQQDKKKSYFFSYDKMGRKISEQNGKQIKFFSYDRLGQLCQITYPSGKKVFYAFDSAGRLHEILTSCGKIHYRFDYEQFDLPVKIHDLIHQTCVQRSYDKNAQLIEEIDTFGNCQKWEYNEFGQLIKSIFPDGSNVSYLYQGSFIHLLKRFTKEGAFWYQHEFSHYNLSGQVDREKFAGKAGSQITHYDVFDRTLAKYNTLFYQEIAIDEIGQVTSYLSNLDSKKYAYDELGQLTQSKDSLYHFDAFCHLQNSIIDDSDQLLELEDIQCEYDLDGNLIKKSSSNSCTQFFYDGLNRLIKMEDSDQKKAFFYDGLSRLVKIVDDQDSLEIFYHFFDEVGSIQNGEIVDLKISCQVGLEDNTSLYYLEKNQSIYIPMVDHTGSIQAVYRIDGALEEFYDLGAFGELKRTDFHLPYQLMGKRRIGSLYSFGFRFLDPDLKRWTTKDPMGFQDGLNVYAFVWNSPINRIDLFGFSSEGVFPYDIKIMIPTKFALDVGDTKGTITVSGFIGGSKVDWVISCGHWHEMKFTAEELESNQANLIDHLPELLPKEGNTVGLITVINGINTTRDEFLEIHQSVYQNVPEGTLTIGLHNPTYGLGSDLLRLGFEVTGLKETKNVIMTRQLMESFSDMFSKTNPLAIWMHVAHSEGGAITYQAIKTMNPEKRQYIQEHLNIVAIAPARPIPKHYGHQVSNVYSDQDFFLAAVGKMFSLHSNYSINFLPSISKFLERSAYFADHAFLGSTYQSAVELLFAKQRSTTPFHSANN